MSLSHFGAMLDVHRLNILLHMNGGDKAGAKPLARQKINRIRSRKPVPSEVTHEYCLLQTAVHLTPIDEIDAIDARHIPWENG